MRVRKFRKGIENCGKREDGRCIFVLNFILCVLVNNIWGV